MGGGPPGPGISDCTLTESIGSHLGGILILVQDRIGFRQDAYRRWAGLDGIDGDGVWLENLG